MQMTKKYTKIIGSAFIVTIFIFMAFGSNESTEKIKIDISNSQELLKYIQGKWSWERYTSDINHTWRYRFEIQGNKIKIWSCFNSTEDQFDMENGYEELTFNLGNPTRDVDGYKARYFEFPLLDDNNFFGITYHAISPIWLVSDDNWDTPVLKCGSGIPSWSREDFKSVGAKIKHANSPSFKSQSDNSYSNSNTYNDDISSKNYFQEQKLNANREEDNQIVDNSWEKFLVEFKAALVNKDKEKILDMTDKENFFSGGGDATVFEFLNEADISKEAGWDNLINSINNGTVGKDEKHTIGNFPNLSFLKKNNRWYWRGIVGD